MRQAGVRSSFQQQLSPPGCLSVSCINILGRGREREKGESYSITARSRLALGKIIYGVREPRAVWAGAICCYLVYTELVSMDFINRSRDCMWGCEIWISQEGSLTGVSIAFIGNVSNFLAAASPEKLEGNGTGFRILHNFLTPAHLPKSWTNFVLAPLHNTFSKWGNQEILTEIVSLTFSIVCMSFLFPTSPSSTWYKTQVPLSPGF